ncbi:hypothetical protein GCM10010399_91830 [Dactylosporangium fulvum]|uniref:Uncharacterized protein n=1 Tax=Dactylosporangium fulvum TaxID=53359 RepID=A0ABY5VNY3_9ACTN|nr:hypothetical protein [Dactylosporangium fulvum]UWP78481.1 hypothetical protein Dfulv_25175 [Dactylosporangium fulvum]
MDGHWEWSESGDTADTADLGADGGGHELGGELGGGLGHETFGAELGGQFGDGGFGDGDLGGHHDAHTGADDLEEPLGTEHAAEDYDHSVAADYGHHDQPADLTSTGFDAGTGDPGDVGDAGDPAGDDPVDNPAAFGTDPDVDALGDDPAWHEVPFPAELHLEGPPEPVDGYPWTDVDVLGGPDHDLSAAFDPAVVIDDPAPPADLATYDGAAVPDGGDPWSFLLGSEDPATSTLANYWAPQA